MTEIPPENPGNDVPPPPPPPPSDGGTIPSFAAPGAPMYQAPAPSGNYDGFAITSMVTGIVGLVFNLCCFFITPILSIVAIVFAFVSFSRFNKPGNQSRGKGMAIAGLICGIVALLIAIAIIIWIIVAGDWSNGDHVYYG
jgi:hypothetical protein